MVESTYDPTERRARTGVSGPGGAGLASVGWRDGEWRGPWLDGRALLDVWIPDELVSGWRELWLWVEGAAPVPVGDLRWLSRVVS